MLLPTQSCTAWLCAGCHVCSGCCMWHTSCLQHYSIACVMTTLRLIEGPTPEAASHMVSSWRRPLGVGSKRPSTGESLDLSGTAKNRHRVASLGSRLPVKRQRSEDVDSSQRMLQLQTRFVRSLRFDHSSSRCLQGCTRRARRIASPLRLCPYRWLSREPTPTSPTVSAEEPCWTALCCKVAGLAPSVSAPEWLASLGSQQKHQPPSHPSDEGERAAARNVLAARLKPSDIPLPSLGISKMSIFDFAFAARHSRLQDSKTT